MRVVDREKKERQIIDAAVYVFAETGYAKTSVSSIAARAGIATGGIYNYFKNKETLFYRCCVVVLNQFLEGLKNELPDNEVNVRNAVLYALRFFRNNPAYAKLVLIEIRAYAVRYPDTDAMTMWFDRISDYILKTLKDQLPPMDGIEPGFYVSVLLGGIEYLVIRWIFTKDYSGMSEIEMAEQITKIIRAES